MSDATPATTPSKTSRRPRSPVERGVVWTLIGLLLLLVLVEFRAQQGYSKSVSSIAEATEGSDTDLSMSQTEALIRMATSRELTVENGIETTYRYSWLSLFKNNQYLLNVVYAKDRESSLLRCWTGTGPDPMTIYMPDPESLIPNGPMPDLVSSGGGNMGIEALTLDSPENEGSASDASPAAGDSESSDTAILDGSDAAPETTTGDGDAAGSQPPD